MDASGSSHPTDQTLRAYGVGKLYGDLADSVHSHLGACAECRQRVAEVSADTFLGRLRDAQVRPESPAPVGPSMAGLSMSEGCPRSTASPASSLPSGLAEHPDYEILGELGRGGMGVVYLASNKLMGRKEVLKVVSRELMDRRGVRDRFVREIRNAAQLHHANIVTAYSAFRAGESIVFAMEYVEGHDLATYVKAQGPLPVAHACNFIYQAALGLQHAHEKGMVHRDIKPSNLILARHGNRPVVKVLDFGLAKATREGPVEKGLTHEGQMLGTPDYIAPEQSLDAHKADIRADIYSLGCTLHYLLTGRPPFRGASLYEVLQAHHSMEAEPLNLVRTEVPGELAAVVAKMMAKDPDRRYQTPGEVAQLLKPFFKPGSTGAGAPTLEVAQTGHSEASCQPAGLGSSPPARSSAETPAPAPPTQTGSASGPRSEVQEAEPTKEPAPAFAEPRLGRRPWFWPAAAAGVLLIGLSLGWAAWALRAKTEDGVIVLQNVPANGVVNVDGQPVPVTASGYDPVKIGTSPGTHRVVVRQGNEILLEESVTVESRKPSRLALLKSADKGGVLLLGNLPENAVVEIDGSRETVTAVKGEPIRIEIRPGTHAVVVKQHGDLLLGESVTLEPGGQRARRSGQEARGKPAAPIVASGRTDKRRRGGRARKGNGHP